MKPIFSERREVALKKERGEWTLGDISSRWSEEKRHGTLIMSTYHSIFEDIGMWCKTIVAATIICGYKKRAKQFQYYYYALKVVSNRSHPFFIMFTLTTRVARILDVPMK